MREWRQRLRQYLREMIARPLAHLPYVFLIGFNKTATTTLHFFFKKNGLPSIHWDNNRLATTMVNNCFHDRPILRGYDRNFRVFSDMMALTSKIRFEANALYRILDADYPEAYFIYSNRDTEEWLASRWKKPCGKYGCTNVELELRLLNSNDPQDVVDTWYREKTAFEAEIRRYFANSDRFLEIDINEPAAPHRIADFLSMSLDPSYWGHHRTNRPGGKMRARIEKQGPCPTPRAVQEQ